MSAGGIRRAAGASTALDVRRGEELLSAWSALARERVSLRAEAADLAFALAARVVGEVAARDRGAVLAALDEALAQAGAASAVLVRAHAEEVEACRDAMAGAPFAFAVAADPTVSRGGVVVETGRGAVDARVEVRLARLREVLGGAGCRTT